MTLASKKIAVYPGSFDPITLGHMDIIHRTTKIFDKIVVAVVKDLSPNALFTIEERCFFIEESLKNENLSDQVSVVSFSGLLIDFMLKRHYQIIIRGLRAVSDFDYEFAMFQMNVESAENKIDTLFLLASKEYSFLSSTMVKEFSRYGRRLDNYTTPLVGDALIKKFKEQ